MTDGLFILVYALVFVLMTLSILFVPLKPEKKDKDKKN